MSDDTDLGEGKVAEDRQEQLEETLEYERWQRRFGKILAPVVLVFSGVMLVCLIVYVFGFRHHLADVSAIAALSGVPTVLLIGLMRYFFRSASGDSDNGDSAATPDQYQLAWTIAHALRSMMSGSSTGSH